MNTEKTPQPLEDPKKIKQEDLGEIETSEAVGSSFEETGVPEEVKEENPENVFIDPEKELNDIATQMETNEARIDAIKEAIESDKKRMDEVRASLGLPPLDNESKAANHNNEELHDLEQEQERLKGERENAAREKELEKYYALVRD